jgi:hypothetical protein
MHPLESYLNNLAYIRAASARAAEASFYSPLANLLNQVGQTLKPQVRCILNLKDIGAGLPDGGLFSADQFPNPPATIKTPQVWEASHSSPKSLPATPPSRGAIEVKSTAADLRKMAHGLQVVKYLGRYRQVLVTNYREFVLMGLDSDNRPIELERYSLAASAAEFWSGAAQPQEMVAEHGERLVDFLKRVMLRPVPLADPASVAWLLASYAREVHFRLESQDLTSLENSPGLTTHESPLQMALNNIRDALEDALDLTFEGEKGVRFFRSSLVQTLFYGIFSAWVWWHHENPSRTDRFAWRLSPWYLRAPLLQALFGPLIQPNAVGAQGLNLEEVLNWAGEALNRVERAEFFSRFETDQAIPQFYDPFLEAFAPELRQELGIWYTPPEVVQYMAARVDTVLREELGLVNGLANEQVYVLDLCCGTGAYLVEVLRRIAAIQQEPEANALSADAVKKAALERIFGFEIMPAPFVLAHLQLGLLLQSLGVPLTPAERASVYLTNTLTGWKPSNSPKQHLLFPALEAERDAAEAIKQNCQILVVLGNLPYHAFTGLTLAEEQDLTKAYRTAKRAPMPAGQNFNDVYVRFFRLAERQIVERSGQGVVCFISNYAWLDGFAYTGMRERYLEMFDKIWVDCLNGDKYRTGKLTPEGEPDPSVFAPEFNREGLQVGTAITVLVRTNTSFGTDKIQFRHFWGKNKRQELRTSLQPYLELKPAPPLGLPFRPSAVLPEYLTWTLLPDLFPTCYPGLKTSRAEVLVDLDRDQLVRRMEQYFSSTITHAQMYQIAPKLMENQAKFNGAAIRDQLRQCGFLPQNIVRYCYRPFDVRWLYWEPELLDRSRPEYFNQIFKDNLWIEARQKQPTAKFDRGYVVRILADNFGNGHSSVFPLYLVPEKSPDPKQLSLFDAGNQTIQPNLSSRASDYLMAVEATPPDLFFHTIAILHAPQYREENADALGQDWPRIPLPGHEKLLRRSAALGQKIAALLDTEQALPGVTNGQIRPELKLVGLISRIRSQEGEDDSAPYQLNSKTDLALTAGWGYLGQGGVIMSGPGQVEQRAFSSQEHAAIEKGAAALGLSLDDLARCLGEVTMDIYLNEGAYWSNVPLKVWDYRLGGHQVVKQWLSYREKQVLGRPLKPEEVQEVTGMVRRLTALVLLEPALNANYQTAKQSSQ